MRALYAVSAGVAAIVLATGPLQAAAPFYAGKTLTWIVGTVPGDAGDLGCRLMAQYMGKYVAGNPTIIVRNMPGADDVIADNYLVKDARNDGLTAICGPIGIGSQLSHAPGLLADLTKFTYIGGWGGDGVLYVRTDTPPGMKVPDDLFKARGLVYGGFAVSSSLDVNARALFSVLGINDYKYVTGFPGGPAGRAALQQKFLNLYQENMTSFVQVTVPTMVKTGVVLPIFQTGDVDASNQVRVRNSQMPDLPTFYEFYQTHFGRPPSGPMWDLAESTLASVDVARDVLALPPNAPPDAAAALNAAIGPLNGDAEFAMEMDKLNGKGSRLAPASLVTPAINSFLDMSQQMKQAYDSLIKSGTAMAQSVKK